MNNQSLRKNISLWIDSVPDLRRYAPLAGAVSCDVAIIGGGITGVFAAWHLSKQNLSVALIEKNHIATGDTGLTTGFLSRVPDTSVCELEKKYGADFVKKLLQTALRSQQNLFQLIHDEKINCDFTSCDSYFCSYEANDHVLAAEFESLQRAAASVSRVSGGKEQKLPFVEAIKFQNEGKWHVRKFLFQLLRKFGAGVKIYEESEVVAVKIDDMVRLTTASGTVTAKKLIVAAGDPGALFPELQPLTAPKITYVVAAKYAAAPLSEDFFWDTFDPYFYFRKVDANTVIVGGCDSMPAQVSLQEQFDKLEKFLTEHLPGDFEITHQWSGSIFHTVDGLPYIFEHPRFQNKVFVACGFGGNGMIFGPLAGGLLADYAVGEKNPDAELFSLARTGARIALPAKNTGSETAQTSLIKKFVNFAHVDEFKSRVSLCKNIAGRNIAVFKWGDRFFAINNVCSHAGGSLADGAFDEGTVTCPLHGAQFNVQTGDVVRPPAVRRQETYRVKLEGETVKVEVQVEAGQTEIATGGADQNAKQKTANTESAAPKETHWVSLLKFASFALAFWILQFLLQFLWLSKDDFESSFIRGSAFAGMTLIALALFSSSIFLWFPKTSVHWRLRRYLGVSGFIFICFHVFGVINFIYNYNFGAIYFSFNPLKNRLIFGSIAFPILFAMASTSTDWAVAKLTPKVWKRIHRFVYVAFLASIFHSFTAGSVLLKNPPGYFLVAITALAVFGEIFWFFKTAARAHFRSVGTIIGIILILTGIILGYFVFWG